MRRRTTAFVASLSTAICLTGMSGAGWAQVVEPPTSHSPALSADGRWLAFISTSDRLIGTDDGQPDNDVEDAFLIDLQTGDARLVSGAPSGQAANGPTTEVDVSADGRYVAFVSEATNLLATDANGIASDVFVLDTQTGALALASRRGIAGTQGNGLSRHVSISDDGSKVAFISYASNLVANDENGQPDAFVRDVAGGTTIRVSTNSSGKEAAAATLDAVISGNGALVAFHNTGRLVREDTNGRRDVYVKVLATEKTQLVSVTNREQPANLDSTLADVSRNGRYVAFTSIATNLVANDTNRVSDAFVRDRSGGTTTRVSRKGSTEANGTTYDAAISPDGAFVAFTTAATNLGDTADANGSQVDAFEYEMTSAVVRHVTHDVEGGWPNGPTFDPTYGTSAVVAFSSWATDLAATDPDPASDVYTRSFGADRDEIGTITHRSVSSGV